MTRHRFRRGVAVAAFLGLVTALLVASPRAEGKGDLADLEAEFRAAIQKAEAAAVVCVARGVAPEQIGFGASGVIVSKRGHVLSDGDVGAYVEGEGGQRATRFMDEIDVRVPDLERGGFNTYRAVVLRRMRGVDSTLLEIQDPPAGGFPDFLVPASSEGLQVGDFLFVTGNAFGGSAETPPATTAGVVSALRPLPEGDAGGRYEYVYTSAAVNPGVNGGPVVDVEGRLVGTVSTFIPPDPGEPYQFLGKVMPMDRVRAVYSDLALDDVFPPPTVRRRQAPTAAALSAAYRGAARRAYPFVVSLEVEREKPLSLKSPGMGGVFDVPRYLGPTSGVLVEADGWIVTSLYNLTNVAELVFNGVGLPLWSPPPPDQVATGLEAIQSIQVHGLAPQPLPARIVAHDARLGVALLKVELPPDAGTTAGARVLEPAPPEAFKPGRFALALGNPFGKDRAPDPLLAVGVLSKLHGGMTHEAWRREWQTDVATTDANCGGALVDLRGRLLGMLHLWSPLLFGRNSGIGFLVPWEDLAAALPRLKEGHSLRRGYLGITREADTQTLTIRTVEPGSPAEKAGLLAGDCVRAIDGVRGASADQLLVQLRARWEGDAVVLEVERDGSAREIVVQLGPRKP